MGPNWTAAHIKVLFETTCKGVALTRGDARVVHIGELVWSAFLDHGWTDVHRKGDVQQLHQFTKGQVRRLWAKAFHDHVGDIVLVTPRVKQAVQEQLVAVWSIPRHLRTAAS